MPERSIHTILKESFSKSSKEDWLRTALHELDENKSLENLIWKSGNINFSPYYDQNDLKSADYLKHFYAPPYRNSNLNAGGWQNLPMVAVLDEKKANEDALKSLAMGADGILFEVSSHSDFDIEKLLKKINWTYCNISFLVSADEKKISAKILSHVRQQNYDPRAIKGAIFWQHFSENGEHRIEDLLFLTEFQPSGIIVQSTSSIHEISKSLLHGVRSMEYLTELGIDKELAFRSISVSLRCEENFFLTIAKFKALRMLWYQLSQAYRINHYEPHTLQIHGRSDLRVDEKFQPRANMIKSSYDAIAFVLGGGDSLTISSPEENNNITQRIALHVSNILKEESQLDKVADTISGAYAIENIVSQLSEEAWKDFQTNVKHL